MKRLRSLVRAIGPGLWILLVFAIAINISIFVQYYRDDNLHGWYIYVAIVFPLCIVSYYLGRWNARRKWKAVRK